MSNKPTAAPNTRGEKGRSTETSDMSHVRQQKQASGSTQSVQTPSGNHEGEGGGEPPPRQGSAKR